jgi:hypothetical protein
MAGQTSTADATAKPTVRRQIFVSYRREDEGWALTITNALRDHFGETRVFQDVDRIDAGTDFVERIEQALDESGAMVALVGHNWMQAGPTGREGINDPADFIRAEIAMALRKGVAIVPVRLGTAEMPRQRQLPAEIAKFARLESKRLDRDHWQEDIRALASRLERLVGKPTRRRRRAATQPETAEPATAPAQEPRAPAEREAELPSRAATAQDAAHPAEAAPEPYAPQATPAVVPDTPIVPIASRAAATSPAEVRRSQRPGWALPALGIGIVGAVAMVAVLLMSRAPAGPTSSPSGGVAGISTSSPTAEASALTSITAKPPLVWEPAQPPYDMLFGAAGVASHKGELWVAGGETSEDDLTSVKSFDPLSGRWTDRPELPQPITHAALVSDGEWLYLIGGIIKGSDGDRVLDTIYRLDDPAGAWTLDGSLLAPRMSGAAAWDGERIVFAGGVASTKRGSRTPSADVWSLERGRWGELDPLQEAREHLAAATDGNGTVWFIGGVDRPNTQVMDSVDEVRASTVTAATPIAVARQGLAAVWTARTGPCGLGGATDPLGRVPSEAVDCPEAASGAVVPPLPAARYVLGAAVIGDSIYVVGGRGTIEQSDTVLVITLR